jgi:carbohydrate kinase (thermoresistant glucokinase family)
VKRIVVMGVSGAGKTTVGIALAERLGLRFVDADDLHPAANVEKMAAGIPLTDDDRWPWLAAVGDDLAAAEEPGLVVACSALKRSYRDAIRARADDVDFVLLTAPAAVLRDRIGHRPGHFMPASLLDSQLAILEPFQSDERGLLIEASGAVEEVAEAAAALLS